MLESLRRNVGRKTAINKFAKWNQFHGKVDELISLKKTFKTVE